VWHLMYIHWKNHLRILQNLMWLRELILSISFLISPIGLKGTYLNIKYSSLHNLWPSKGLLTIIIVWTCYVCTTMPANSHTSCMSPGLWIENINLTHKQISYACFQIRTSSSTCNLLSKEKENSQVKWRLMSWSWVSVQCLCQC